jgi:prephenate dehydrogenase
LRTLNDCTFGIAGLGLMGGAIAAALREKCGIARDRLFACDKDIETMNTARQAGVIARGWYTDNAGEMLSFCDIVFLCINPSAVINFLEKWTGYFKSGSLITDIAGTKVNIAAAAEKFLKDAGSDGIDFIPGHPMAGAEKSGFANSGLCDFNGKNYILTPLSRNKRENLVLLKDIIRRMGFAVITEVTPAEHDNKIAFTSQLCHIIAAALIDCEPDTDITRFGGGSFEDLTRIAMLNAPMWTELFIENGNALLDRISNFQESLDKLKSLIGGANAAELEKKLELIRDRRLAMKN